MISIEEFKENVAKFGDLNPTPTPFGETPLRVALIEGYSIEYIRVLVEAGAGRPHGKWSDQCALHWAAEGGQAAEVIRYLAEQGAPVNYCRYAQGTDGAYPLHCAYKSGNAETISALLELGADPEAHDCFGRRLEEYRK